jgi:hypothetical protein
MNALARVSLGGGLPADVVFSLELNPTNQVLIAATDSRVYTSEDGGGSWMDASQGLPKRPHRSDLRFVAQPSGQKFLYLSTFGAKAFDRIHDAEVGVKRT